MPRQQIVAVPLQPVAAKKLKKVEGNYSAYVPDLPGCVSIGATIVVTEKAIREAITFHRDGTREDGMERLFHHRQAMSNMSILLLRTVLQRTAASVSRWTRH